MKKSAILLAALGFGFSALFAQTVPEFLNYQGTVTDSAGVGLGDTDPVNRKVLFRVFDAATGNGLIWTEEQAVTISKGQFSVLLGQGIPFDSLPHASLLSVFGEGATDRYLEITVDNGDGTLNASDLPITPRQRITSTAYSFRAGTADSIASGSSLQLNTTDSGLGYYDDDRKFGGFDISGPVLYGAGGGALGAKIGAAETSALRWDSAGNIGIGTNSPLAGKKLHVVGNSYFNGDFQVQGLSSFSGRVDMSDRLRVTGSEFSFFDNQLVVGGQGTPTSSSFKLTVEAGYTDLNGLRISGGDTANTIYQATGDIGINTASHSQSVKIGSNVNGTVMTVKNSKVGIGTADPDASLEIGGANNRTDAFLITGSQPGIYFNNTSSGRYWNQWVEKAGQISAAGSLVFYNGPSGGYRMVIEPGGNVGIGTYTPTRGKLEVSGVSGIGTSLSDYGVYSNTNYFTTTQANGTGSVSIYASGRVTAADFIAHSDERIKDIKGRSDSVSDLATLQGIEVTDYTYIDTFEKGAGAQKKVIAQQVQTVFPQAVVKSTDVLPDIYELAPIQSGWVTLATNLKQGDRVRLIGEKNEGIHEVLEVVEGRFRTDFVTSNDQVFVYGREVDDFGSVDYEAIAMLNVSATQELARQIALQSTDLASLHVENRQLKTRLAALEAKDAAREARLAAIEALLSAE